MSSSGNEFHIPPQSETVPSRRNDHLLLWVMLMLALLATSIWWLLNQPWAGGSSGATDRVVVVAQAPTATTPTPVIPTPAPAVAAPTNQDIVAGTAGKSTATKKSAAENRRDTRSVARLTRNARPLADNPPPKYPVAALRAGVEGLVLVRAEIGTDGTPTDVGYARRSGDRDLDRAALSAVRNWRFRPALRNGKAVASVIQVPVDFVLDERAM